MSHAQKPNLTVLSLLAVLWLIAGTSSAKSLYVISDTGTEVWESPLIQAYQIDGNDLIHRADYYCKYPLATGLAIDSDAGFLFVTHEEIAGKPETRGNLVEIVNAKSMTYAGAAPAPGANNLAGIVYDRGKKKVYVVDRKTPNLFVYSWDWRTPKLVLLERVKLTGLINATSDQHGQGGAWGLALDEDNHRLYVTSNEKKVRSYDTRDWSHDPNTDFVMLSQKAIGIALDVNNGYAYTGTAWVGPEGEVTDDLNQYDLAVQGETTVNIGAEVIGIAVDQDSSLVYLTTYGSSYDIQGAFPPDDRLLIYDSNLTRLWMSDDIGNPAGVAVPETDLSYKPPLLMLDKTDDVNDGNCVLPGNDITYTIGYDANGHSATNVKIIDYLSFEVDYNVGFPPNIDFNYSPADHTYIWDLGSLSPNDSGMLTLTVTVNKLAEPLGVIMNRCAMESDASYNILDVCTPVCSWNPGIIYVNTFAPTAVNTGMSWEKAYLDLQHGLDRAGAGNGSQIWVAKGTYKPDGPLGQSNTFQLVSGAPVYGHFAGWESSISQRNLHNPNNETILSGYIDADDSVFVVVTASNVNEATLLNGFTITEAYSVAIYIDSGSPIISDCNIHHNYWHAISTNTADATINNCIIHYNYYDAIRANNNTAAALRVYNNLIHHNSSGIYLIDYTDASNVTIRNNTIVQNENYGVYVSAYAVPSIMNCVVWGNADDIQGCTATSSCVQENGDDEPCFINPSEPNEFHLGPNSPCIDAGDSNLIDPNETDIDGEDRIMKGKTELRVDIGADELCWPKCDYDRSEIVNFVDFTFFANAWHETNTTIDLDDDNFVDINDLVLFCSDWLWVAPWSARYEQMSKTPWGMDGGSGGRTMDTQTAIAAPTQAPGFMPGVHPTAPAQSEPLSTERIEELIEWTESLLEDEERTLDESKIQIILDSLKAELPD